MLFVCFGAFRSCQGASRSHFASPWSRLGRILLLWERLGGTPQSFGAALGVPGTRHACFREAFGAPGRPLRPHRGALVAPHQSRSQNPQKSPEVGLEQEIPYRTHCSEVLRLDPKLHPKPKAPLRSKGETALGFPPCRPPKVPLAKGVPP